MNGYTGKILRINLTDRKTSTIDTAAYEQWGGGHGIGSAIFFDLVKDKTIDGFDPANVVTIMTSPLTGTIVPGGGAARVEMQGIGIQSSPIGWFTRSNFGGRFGAMLKFAGWDGIVIEGAADRPVWVDIRNDSVQIKDASSLWGLDTWKTQNEIWKEVSGKADFTDWFDAGDAGSWKRSTQRPAVLCIGKAGENKSRIASIIHDAGNGAGQGGFGGVWGAKNLKAISVIGTGSVQIADAQALLDARAWAMKQYATSIDDIKGESIRRFVNGAFGAWPEPMSIIQYPKQSRPQACMGCHAGCRIRTKSGSGNESSCMTFGAYNIYDLYKHSNPLLIMEVARTGNYALLQKYGKQTSASFRAADLFQQYGINATEIFRGLSYLCSLAQLGVLGPGKSIDCDLPFASIGNEDFIEALTKMIALREGEGDAMAEGFYRAAGRWGRLEEDLASGILLFPHWGVPEHMQVPAQVEWGFGSLLSDRDINEHDFCFLNNLPGYYLMQGKQPPVAAEDLVALVSEKLAPYAGDAALLDFSTENMYSESMAKLVAWHRHYTRFWKQSALYCDFQFADLYSQAAEGGRGLTGEGEQKFYNAVTGRDLSFEDGMELGRKIWSLDNAIWTLQGRHRALVKFADYIYSNPLKSAAGIYRPGKENGQWKYIRVDGRSIDREKFETFKTNFYTLEGWDTASGWPTRSTLEGLDLGYVADELEANGKLGA